MTGPSRIALDMVNQDELLNPPALRRPADLSEPRQHNQKKNPHAAGYAPLQDGSPLSHRGHKRKQDQSGQDNPNQTLGEGSQSHQRIGNPEFFGTSYLKDDPHPKVQRQGKKEGEWHIGMRPAPFPDNARRGGKDNGTEKSLPGSEQVSAKSVGCKHQANSRKRRGQTHAPLTHSAEKLGDKENPPEVKDR